MNILFILSGNISKASSRVRGYWIAEEIEKSGYNCHLIYAKNRFQIFKILLGINKYDVFIFQKTYSRNHLAILFVLNFFKKKTFLDIDDFPSISKNKKTLINFKKMVNKVSKVFCGSQNLFEYVENINLSKPILIPTSIKIPNYPITKSKKSEKICLGWIGNGKYYKEDLIKILYDPIKKISENQPTKLKLIGTLNQSEIHRHFEKIKNLEVEFIENLEWNNPLCVSQALRDVHIGLYPLLNNDFNHYKCGFKALEYMALKIPVIASPISANKYIIQNGYNGYLANSNQQWYTILNTLMNNYELRHIIGENSREFVCSNYSVKKTAKKIIAELK